MRPEGSNLFGLNESGSKVRGEGGGAAAYGPVTFLTDWTGEIPDRLNRGLIGPHPAPSRCASKARLVGSRSLFRGHLLCTLRLCAGEGKLYARRHPSTFGLLEPRLDAMKILSSGLGERVAGFVYTDHETG